MMRLPIALTLGAVLAATAPAVSVETQGPDEHIAKARAASGADFGALLGVTCDLVKPPAGAAPPAPAAPAAPAKVFDNAYFVGTRAAGAPHPYVVGKEAVRRYLTVADECAVPGASASVVP